MDIIEYKKGKDDTRSSYDGSMSRWNLRLNWSAALEKLEMSP
jgi:hypothetical protein